MILGASHWIIRNNRPGFSRWGLTWLMIILHHCNRLLSVCGRAHGLIMGRPPRSGKGKPYGRHKKLLLFSSNLVPEAGFEPATLRGLEKHIMNFGVYILAYNLG